MYPFRAMIKMSVTPEMDFVAISAQTFLEVTTAHAQTHFTWILKTNEHVKPVVSKWTVSQTI